MRIIEYLRICEIAEDAGIASLLDTVSDAADTRVAMAISAALGDALAESLDKLQAEGKRFTEGQVVLAGAIMSLQSIQAFLMAERERMSRLSKEYAHETSAMQPPRYTTS